MKCRSHFLLAIILLMMVVACQNNEDVNIKRLRQQVEEINSTCPVSWGIAGDILSVKYNDKENIVQMQFLLTEVFANVSLPKQNHSILKENMSFIFKMSKSQPFTKDIIAAKSGVNFVFKSKSTYRTDSISFRYEEIKEICDAPDLNEKEIARIFLNNSIALRNTTLPEKQNDGMYLDKVEIDNGYLVYSYSMDETMYDMDVFRKVIKENTLAYLKGLKNDPILKRDISQAILLNLGYQYRYYGKTSRKYFDIFISVEELEAIVE